MASNITCLFLVGQISRHTYNYYSFLFCAKYHPFIESNTFFWGTNVAGTLILICNTLDSGFCPLALPTAPWTPCAASPTRSTYVSVFNHNGPPPSYNHLSWWACGMWRQQHIPPDLHRLIPLTKWPPLIPKCSFIDSLQLGITPWSADRVFFFLGGVT